MDVTLAISATITTPFVVGPKSFVNARLLSHAKRPFKRTICIGCFHYVCVVKAMYEIRTCVECYTDESSVCTNEAVNTTACTAQVLDAPLKPCSVLFY